MIKMEGDTETFSPDLTDSELRDRLIAEPELRRTRAHV
jgi:hypothetical protein